MANEHDKLREWLLESKTSPRTPQRPDRTLRKIYRADEDPWIFRSIVWILGGAIFVSIITYGILWSNGVCQNTEFDTALVAVASASVGALAAMLNKGAR